MGRGSRAQASGAQQLLYGRRQKGSGPQHDPRHLITPAEEELDRLLAKAPDLPEKIMAHLENPPFGDSRHDAAWLEKFGRYAMLSDGFTDTAVEEVIVGEILSGNSSFSSKSWAEVFKDDSDQPLLYPRMLKEGERMAEIIESYQEDDLEVSRLTLRIANERIALRVALARLEEGETNPDKFSWQERHALQIIKGYGGEADLGIKIKISF